MLQRFYQQSLVACARQTLWSTLGCANPSFAQHYNNVRTCSGVLRFSSPALGEAFWPAMHLITVLRLIKAVALGTSDGRESSSIKRTSHFCTVMPSAVSHFASQLHSFKVEDMLMSRTGCTGVLDTISDTLNVCLSAMCPGKSTARSPQS
jgi:hypothetical protein